MYYVGPIGGTSHELFKTPLLALGIINLKRSHGFFFHCLVLGWLLLKKSQTVGEFKHKRLFFMLPAFCVLVAWCIKLKHYQFPASSIVLMKFLCLVSGFIRQWK